MIRIDGRNLERALDIIERVVDRGWLDSGTSQLIEQSGVPRLITRQLLGAAKNLLVEDCPRAGLFIVVSGVDRVGKETQCFNTGRFRGVESISSFLRERGYRVLRLNPPTYETLLGSLVSAQLGRGSPTVSMHGKVSDNSAWILWSLDRAQYNPRLMSWLSRSRGVVLSKGWLERHLVYQKANGVPEQRITRFERNIVKQDYTIILSAPLETVMRRIAIGGPRDAYESREMLRKVMFSYRNLSKTYPFGEVLTVDASKLPSQVNVDVLRIVRMILKQQ